MSRCVECGEDPRGGACACQVGHASSRRSLGSVGSSQSFRSEEVRTEAYLDLGPGSVLGAYEILRVLGEGGMGKVFLAEHQKLGREVAIKVLHPEHASKPEAVRRFFTEARAVNRIRDEHIVEVTDFSDEGPYTYCVMEYLDGRDLAEILKDGHTLSSREAVELGVQTAMVLSKVHAAGIVHRDLKPANIFVTRRNGEMLVKLLDFGIAKVLHDDQPTSLNLTVDGMILGTPEYMSPEQAGGQVVDYRTDVYSLGLVLYAAVTGGPPFTASSYGEMVVKHLTVTPPRPSDVLEATRGRVPPSLEAVILSCLEKEREKRPQGMTEVVKRLEAARAELATEARVSQSDDACGISSRQTGLSFPIWGKRARILLFSTASLLVASVLVFSFWPSSDSRTLAGIAAVEIASESSTPADELPPGSSESSIEFATERGASPRTDEALVIDVPSKGETTSEGSRDRVDIVLQSRPPGAVVYKGAGVEPMGKTPLNLSFERRDDVETFRFELPGHQAVSENVPLHEPMRLSVVLPKTEPRPRAPQRRTSRSERTPHSVKAAAEAAPLETEPAPGDLIDPFGG